MTLYGDFLTSNQRRSHKWFQYFPIYEQHFERFRNRHVTLLEIGIGEGGSLQQWRRYLGPYAVIIGVDINPLCKQVEEDQIHVRIGSQNDRAFLAALAEEFGPFDIVIDDGSHVQTDINVSFDVLFPHVLKNGVYLVEDLHAAYWPGHAGGLRHPGSFIERAKDFVDQIHAQHSWAEFTGDGLPRTPLGDRLCGVHFYDSVAVLEVGEYRDRRSRNALLGNAALFRDDYVPPEPAAPAASNPPPWPDKPVTQETAEQVMALQRRIRQLEAALSAAPPRPQAAAQVAAPPPVLTPPVLTPPDLTPPDLTPHVRALEAALETMRASTSWRLTAPVRALGKMVRGG